MANGRVVMWECKVGHEHKKKREAGRCSERAEKRARKALAVVSQPIVSEPAM